MATASLTFSLTATVSKIFLANSANVEIVDSENFPRIDRKMNKSRQAIPHTLINTFLASQYEKRVKYFPPERSAHANHAHNRI